MLHINQLFTSHHSLLTSYISLLTSYISHLTSYILPFTQKKRTCYTGKHKCNKQEWGLGNFLLPLQPQNRTSLRKRKTNNERRKTNNE